MAPSTSKGGGVPGVALRYDDDGDEGDAPATAVRAGYRSLPILNLNGRPVPAALAGRARPGQTLLDFLRVECGLTGTKLGCGEGGCGACTVLLSRYCRSDGAWRGDFFESDREGDGAGGGGGGRGDGEGGEEKKNGGGDGRRGGRIVHTAVNACLFPVLAADGCHVTTVEGVGSWRKEYRGLSAGHGAAAAPDGRGKEGGEATKDDYLHPIQRAMVDMHGSQCGYCTPGIVMALYGLFAPDPDGDEPRTVARLEEHLDGNLCRCTGYRPIWDAARSLCVDSVGGEDVENCGPRGPCGTPCRDCPERDACEAECNVEDRDREDSVVRSSTESKVAGYRAVLRDRHPGKWWDQPDRMFPDQLIPDDGSESKRRLDMDLMVVDASVHDGGTWFQPNSLEGLLDLFREFGNGLKMVVGNTEVGIERAFKHAVYPRMVRPSERIHSLYDIFGTDDHLIIGACASLGALQRACHRVIDAAARSGGKATSLLIRRSRTAAPMHDMLRWFASTQIRNVACLGGNLATASPISDMNPVLAALGATLVLASCPRPDGGVSRRRVPASDFFVGYRRTRLVEGEVIERVDVPLLGERFEYAAPFKQARRREDDISIVTAGMRIKLAPGGEGGEKEDGWTIEDVSLAFGGMAPKTVMASKAMAFLVGNSFGEGTFAEARKVLMQEFRLPEDVPGGQAEYRLALACGFLHQFYLHCVGELWKDVYASMTAPGGRRLSAVPAVAIEEALGAGSGFVSEPKPSVGGVQTYPRPRVAVGLEAERAKTGDPTPPAAAAGAGVGRKEDAVGRPAAHASGPLHCTGEALYADDIPAPPNTLHGSLILASKCHVELMSVDVLPALRVPGVAGAFIHEDIVKLGGDNAMGPIFLDDVAFLPVGDRVDFVGQVLGIVVGVSQEIAAKGARAVAVEYSEEMEGKAVVSIEDAIEANSFWTDIIHEMRRGEDPAEIMKQKEVDGKRLVVVEGSMRTGGQEHFYLEPNSTLAVPSESATNLTIYASTQAPTKTQDFCARVTNTPAAKVVVRMKRMGGGFGGKETRSVFSSVAAAVAAKLTNQPVRLTLSRDVDMAITGGRHSFLATYKAGAIVDETDGSVKLHALDVRLYNNGGCKFDLTGPVLDRALFHVDGCYLWPNFHSVGTPCRTSQPPHTAFRGFGGPQGIVVCEHIMDHLALACGVSGDDLRRDNMYTLDDHTPFGMRFGGQFTGKWNVPSMWDRLYDDLNVRERRAAAMEFNDDNKWVKRGVGFVPTKFGIAFTAKFMNQGGALVHLYTDGTVLVSHGGTEMGQGLHTKVCQVAAQAFGIPLDDVYVNDSSTDKVANTLPSAASMSTDMYGMATLNACRQILQRLRPIREALPYGATIKEVAKEAFMQRVDLSAHGFFALDDDRCGYDWAKERPKDYPDGMPENSWKGHPFNYFTQGVALAEVEINVLTGNFRTISADVLVDVGSSINPAIDIGQIEGAFIQGMGWSTIEEVIYADSDHTWIRPRAKAATTGPGTYKIPAFNDAPESFNVSLLEDAENPFAVHSSKAIGEPPFFLGCSVFFAIKDAVAAAREDRTKENADGGGYFEFRLPATSERIRMSCMDDISSECIALSGKSPEAFQPKGTY